MPHPELAHLSDALFKVTLTFYVARGRRLPRRAGVRPSWSGAHRSRARTTVAVPEERALVGAGAPVPVDPPEPPVLANQPEESRRWLTVGAIALGLTVVGWMFHVAEVVTRGIGVMRVPWGNMYEFSSAICLVAVDVVPRAHRCRSGSTTSARS